MGIFGAVLLFVSLIIVYVLIAEVFTVLFRLTGLTEEKVRFQVISLLTNSGYTTEESELVTQIVFRRKLARIIMMFGYAFTVTIVSSVVNIFLAAKLTDINNIILSAPWPLLLIVLVVIFRRNRKVRSWFDRKIQSIGAKLMFHNDENRLLLLDTYGSMAMAEVYAARLSARLKNVRVADAMLRDDNILVMLKRTSDGTPERVDGGTVMNEGDTFILFGPLERIREVFLIATDSERTSECDE